MLTLKKRGILYAAIASVLVTGVVGAAGFHLGPTSAVKSQLKKLDREARRKKWELQGVKLGPNTIVLLEKTDQHFVKKEGSTYHYTSQAKEFDDIKAGDIIVSTRGEGFLRRVTSVNLSGGEYLVQTTASTMEEAFESVDVEFTKTLTPNDLSTSTAAKMLKGVSIHPAGVPGKFYVKLDNVILYDIDGDQNTKGDQIVANGEISFTVGINPKIVIRWFDLKELKFIKTIDESATLTLDSMVGISLQKEVAIATFYFAPIPAGPIIFVPEISVVVGGVAQVGLKTSAGITQQASYSAGISYSNGVWSPVSQFSSDFQFSAPSISFEGDIKCYTGPKLALKIYGVLGPYLSADGYLKLSTVLSGSNIDWTLYGGLEGLGGVEMTILSFIKVGYSATLLDYQIIIASGTVPTAIITWNVTYDSGSDDYARAIAVDGVGNVYVTGQWANGTNTAYRTIKYDATGAVLWNVTYDGGFFDRAFGIAVDGVGNVYVTGQSSNGVNSDYRTIKYDAGGGILWNVTYDSGDPDTAFSVAVDGAGNVYVTGASGIGAAGDYRTIKYDAIGAVVWNVAYDGGNDDLATDVAVDGAGNVYVTGRSFNGVNYDYRTIKYSQ